MAEEKKKAYFTPEELVSRWEGKITLKTLANWRSSAAQKGGPPFDKIGGRILYPVPATIAWEETRAHT